MTRILRASIAAIPLVASLACGSSLNGPGGGTAGSSGTGGATGGTTGTGGIAVWPPPPTCLVDLVASCPITGSCQFQNGDGGSIAKACFATGETISPVLSACDEGTQEVRRADGTLCYSFLDQNQACEVTERIWIDAAGSVVARALISASGGSGYNIIVTCEGTGERCMGRYIADRPVDRQPCLPGPAWLSCPVGTCP